MGMTIVSSNQAIQHQQIVSIHVLMFFCFLLYVENSMSLRINLFMCMESAVAKKGV